MDTTNLNTKVLVVLQKILNRIRIVLLLTIIAGWIIISASSGLITEGIWFNHLGFGKLFISIISSKIIIHGAVFILTFFLYYLNLRIALRSIIMPQEDIYLPRLLKLYRDLILNRLPVKALNILFIFIGLIVAIYTTYGLDTGWAIWLQFLHRTPFGISDPVLGLDVGFYVFVLPVIEVLQSIFLPLLFWLLPVTITTYTVFNPTQLLGWRKSKLNFGQKHLLIQISALLILLALGLIIQALRLTLTSNPLFLGANYTDIHVRLPGYLLIALSIIVLALLFLWGCRKWHPKLVFVNTILALLIILLSLWGTPSFVQRLMVEPNQFAREKTYLEYHIGMTRQAYGLDKVEVRQFPTDSSNTGNLDRLEPTLANIRLWDWRPLQLSYNQLQALSYYYDFSGIDVDRYVINNKPRQVMLAAREIDLNRFEPHVQTWTNTHLRYTHGYGLAMSPVDEATSNGLPRFLIKDIPPNTPPDLKLSRPEIYFGELTYDYAITNTNIKEFDYPKGEDNAETIYQGNGGIPLDSYLKRLLFATRFKDYRLLISNELNANSQILYHRQIADRVQRIAPFLKLDDDPYLVLEEGRLFWLLDAYTATDNFPYSAITPGWGNYIRNSIKVLVDAYNGDVTFYLADKSDPLALTWQKAFPDLFQDLKEMPSRLQTHLRYPVDLFRIQGEVYAKYHMVNPLTFYNDEDAWKIPEEKFQEEIVPMDPYYTILQLEQLTNPEFILMLPFIPAKQISNMVAWMAALNDPPDYGKLIVYRFFKDQHVYGPMQIESRIDQDSEISQQLTLWDQRGSRVIRGNLLVIPLNGAILYVEPIFIQSEQSSIPELSRVIIVFEDQVIMARTLPEALEQILGQPLIDVPEREETLREGEISLLELSLKAKSVYEQALEAQKVGDWGLYGTYLTQLEDILNQMVILADPEDD